MTELEALRAEVAEMRALMASAAPSAPVHITPIEPVPWVYTPAPTQPLAVIASSPELRHLNERGVRQLAAAVAICQGGAIPGEYVPVEFEVYMKRLAKLRAAGVSWRAALSECGLEVPDDDEIAHQSQASRDALRGLWDGVSGLLAQLEHRLPSWVFDDLLRKLRPLL